MRITLKAERGNVSYVVLGLEIDPAGEAKFRVEETIDTPGLVSLADIQEVFGRPPALWTARRDSGGLDLYPEEWHGDFWSRFFDQDINARASYRSLRARLEAMSRETDTPP